MNGLVLPLVLLAEITLIAGLALLACRIWRHDAAARYGAGLTAMVLLWLALPLTLALRAAGLSTLLWRETVYTAPIREVPMLGSAAAAPAEPSRGGLLFVLWAAGAALILARLAYGFFKVRKLRKTASPLPHLKGAAPVYVTEEVSGPVVVGALRPSVLIPSSVLDNLSETELADVLAHEFAHVARRHLLVAIMQRLTVALLWPHPFVHFLSRQIVEAREEVCDNVVLTSAGRARYARILLRVAECRRPSGHFSASLGLFGSESHLEKRVKSLLDPHRRISTEMNFPRIATVTALMLLGVGAFAGARIETEIVAVDPDGMTAPAAPSQKAVVKQVKVSKASKPSKTTKIKIRKAQSKRDEEIRVIELKLRLDQKREAQVELKKALSKVQRDQELRVRELQKAKSELDRSKAQREKELEIVRAAADEAKRKAELDKADVEKIREMTRAAADEAKRKAELDKADVEKIRRMIEEEVKKDKSQAREDLRKALADRERALEEARKELEKAKKQEKAEKKKRKGGDDLQIEIPLKHDVQVTYDIDCQYRETKGVPILKDIPIIGPMFRIE